MPVEEGAAVEEGVAVEEEADIPTSNNYISIPQPCKFMYQLLRYFLPTNTYVSLTIDGFPEKLDFP